MPEIGPNRVEAARRLTRAITRGLAAEGELPAGVKPIDEVISDVEAWFDKNDATLAEFTVDLGYLYADRLLGGNVEAGALLTALANAGDEDVVRYQEQRVADLQARLETSRTARAELYNALGFVFQQALGFALQAVLPR